MKIEIKSRFSGDVLFAHETDGNTIRLTLEAAVSARASLDGASLDGASLDGASLDGASLVGASLARANLSGAYLSGAYLDGASLARANLSGETLTKAPLSLLNLKWSVLITAQYMRIGCQRHTHDEWKSFTDSKIKSMSYGALEFWRKWKAPLLALCDEHSKTDEGSEGGA